MTLKKQNLNDPVLTRVYHCRHKILESLLLTKAVTSFIDDPSITNDFEREEKHS